MSIPKETAEKAKTLERQLEQAGTPEKRLDILIELGKTLWIIAPAEAEVHLKQAREEGKKVGSPAHVARAANMLADVLRRREEFEAAEQGAQEALGAARQSGDGKAESATLNTLSLICEARGEYDKSLEWAQQSLKTARTADYLPAVASSLNQIGGICLRQGRPQEALKYYTECLDVDRKLEDREGLAIHHYNIALAYQVLGEWEKSAEHLYRAISLSEQNGHDELRLNATNVLGEVYLKRNKLREARTLFEQTVEGARSLGRCQEVLRDALCNTGETKFKAGDLGAAERTYTEALALSEQADDRWQLARLYWRIAELALAQGQLERSKTYLARAARLADEVELGTEKAEVWRVRAKLQAEEEDPDAARESYKTAMSQLKETTESHELARVRLEYARFLIEQGDKAEAIEQLRAAADTFKEHAAVAESEEANRLLFQLHMPSDGEAALVGGLAGLAAVGLEPGSFFEQALKLLCDGLKFECGAVLVGERPIVLFGWPAIDQAVEMGRTCAIHYEPQALSVPVCDGGEPLGSVFLGREKPDGTELGRAVLDRIGETLAGPLKKLSQLTTGTSDEGVSIPGLHYRGFIGSNPVLIDNLKTVVRVASAPIPVLVRGDSGTGKEYIARALHDSGERRDKPFVAINCAAVPETLLEAEFFGVEKGAATGVVARKGKFELADGGTVFLDEVGDMSTALQARLLRVLQEKVVEPVGGQKRVEVDVRVVAATNQKLEDLMKEGKFRPDLFYRLNAVELVLPPLNERKEDIPELVRFFITRSNQEFGRNVLGASDGVMGRFMAYDWPGNVRQLQHVVERAVVLAKGQVLEEGDLPPEFQHVTPEKVGAGAGGLRKARKVVRTSATADVERAMVIDYLGKAEWNVSKAAELAGYSRAQFYRLMTKYRVSRPK